MTIPWGAGACWQRPSRLRTGLRTTARLNRVYFNVFKMLRPVVVLDEAHKAYGSNRMQRLGSLCATRSAALDPQPSPRVVGHAPQPRASAICLVDISRRGSSWRERGDDQAARAGHGGYRGQEWQYTLLGSGLR